MANINEFKSRLKGGGARANQFKVTLPFPGYSSVGVKHLTYRFYVLQQVFQDKIFL
jgi:hypothetical protein